jgi:hypothetical protein
MWALVGVAAMKTRIRTIYLVRSAQKEQDARPSVFIEVTKGNEIVYGVRASGSSLKRARQTAEVEFALLKEFVRLVKDGDLTTAMAKSLVELNHGGKK